MAIVFSGSPAMPIVLLIIVSVRPWSNWAAYLTEVGSRLNQVQFSGPEEKTMYRTISRDW